MHGLWNLLVSMFKFARLNVVPEAVVIGMLVVTGTLHFIKVRFGLNTHFSFFAALSGRFLAFYIFQIISMFERIVIILIFKIKIIFEITFIHIDQITSVIIIQAQLLLQSP